MKVVKTPVFRVNWPNVIKPKFNKLSKKDEYSLEAIFDLGADLSALKEACQAAIEEKWPNPTTRPKAIKLPFREQTDKAVLVDGKEVLPAGYTKGGIYIRLKSDQRPGLVDQKVKPIVDTSEFYSGCYAWCKLNAFAYDQAGNRGVSFGLGNIQKVKEGEPLSGRPTPEQDFAPIQLPEGEGSATSLFS